MASDCARAACALYSLGLRPYAEAWGLQRRLVAARADGRVGDTVLFVEHPHVVTLGRSTKEDPFRVPAALLEEAGVEVYEVERGGEATYHGPGQLVCYPILSLELFGRDIGRYLRALEEAVIRTASAFGVEAGRVPGRTGVWVGGEKLAAIGIAASRWVTYHGLALNVSPDLSKFGLIVPCGMRGAGVTSLEALLGRPVEVAEVEPVLARALEEALGLELCERDAGELEAT